MIQLGSGLQDFIVLRTLRVHSITYFPFAVKQIPSVSDLAISLHDFGFRG